VGHAGGQEPQTIRPWGGGAWHCGAWRSLCLGNGTRLRTRVLPTELLIDIIYALAKCREIIEGVGGATIDCNMSADARSKSSFEVEARPVHVNNVLTNLGNDSLEFSVILKNGAGALCHILNREAELTSIICTGEAGFERLDELVEGGELGGRRVFRHEPEFRGAGEEGCCSFHLFLFIGRCSDVRTNLEDPGIDHGEGRVLPREGWGFCLFQCRGHHDGRRGVRS